MLFHGTNQDHPKGYCISFMPNQDNLNLEFICGCCSSQNTEEGFIDDLPTIVVDSAKDVVLETIKRKAEEASKSEYDKRLTRIESLLYKLLETANK